MKLQTYSYRYAEEVLEHPKFRFILEEIMTICNDAPIPKYQGKSKRQPKLDVVQQVINSYFWHRFRDFGWEDEPHTTPDDFQDELRGDFKKEFKTIDNEAINILIEVELGNVASSYRDYFKFQLSYAYDLADICVLIVPLDKLAKRIDSGVSNFEKTCKELPSAKLSITVPILVIGLDPKGEVEWDVKAVEPNLKVLKNSSKSVRKKHHKIIEDYISSL